MSLKSEINDDLVVVKQYNKAKDKSLEFFKKKVNMKIDLSELRVITENLFNHLGEKGVDSIELKSDHYWNISEEHLYDPYNEPKKFTMGQLSDDWQELQKIAHGKSDTIAYAFVWLASILRAIGEKEVS